MSGELTIQDSLLPLEGAWQVTSPFGWRYLSFLNWNFHNGIDLVTSDTPVYGQPIISPADGYVYNDVDDYGGLYQNIYTGGGSYWQVIHNSQFSVTNGSYVKQGDAIGLVGNTGLSDAPHLHIGFFDGSRWIDPTNLILQFNQSYMASVQNQLTDLTNKVDQLLVKTEKPSFSGIDFEGKRWFITKGDSTQNLYIASFDYETNKIKKWAPWDGLTDRDHIDFQIKDGQLYIFLRGQSGALNIRKFDGKGWSGWIN